MDEDNLNIEIRRFLKKVGITSQREIENYIRKKFSKNNLQENQSIEISMNLSSNDGELSHIIKEKIIISKMIIDIMWSYGNIKLLIIIIILN